MKYRLVKKDSKKQPPGVYTDNGWKEQIAAECYHQCVYCTINEQHWGGIDHYHIDHFWPKSIDRFKNLENDICNLFYSCPVCNRFKGNSWPADPDLDVPSFPDPSVTDYASIFDFDESFSLIPKYTSSAYVIEKLYLNRPQLIYERREFVLREKENQLSKEVIDLLYKVIDKELDKDLVKKTIEVITVVKEHLSAREKIRPYKISEIKKA